MLSDVGKSMTGLASDPPFHAESKEHADPTFLLSLNRGIMQVKSEQTVWGRGETCCAPDLLAARSRAN